MSTPVYDAVVVGGGPAGASAAHALAQGAARVLLLEKASIPRYKPCGGGITARARAASPLLAGFAPETEASSIHLSSDDSPISCTLPTPVSMTMRSDFDAYLVRRAVAAGATLRDGVALSGLEAEGASLRLRVGRDCVLARYVVGADGANGITGRLAGFSPCRAYATAIEVEVGVPDAACARYRDTALFDFQSVPGGYAWIFGKDGQLSTGVGTFSARGATDLRPSLARFLATHPDLRGGEVRLQRGHRIPLAGGRTSRRHGRVLLAGDAAALADPLTGEGIGYALASGRRAGATILDALHGASEALAGYERYLQNDLCGDLRYARLAAALVYRYPGLLLRLTREHPGLRTAATGAICGTLTYRSLVVRLALGVPKLARHLVALWYPIVR